MPGAKCRRAAKGLDNSAHQ